jgi:hypothetical protein
MVVRKAHVVVHHWLRVIDDVPILGKVGARAAPGELSDAERRAQIGSGRRTILSQFHDN